MQTFFESVFIPDKDNLGSGAIITPRGHRLGEASDYEINIKVPLWTRFHSHFLPSTPSLSSKFRRLSRFKKDKGKTVCLSKRNKDHGVILMSGTFWSVAK